jgi:hypothetical protein
MAPGAIQPTEDAEKRGVTPAIQAREVVESTI